MPKSSAAKRTPMARKASKLANRAGLPNATDSVSSISRSSAGRAISASTRFTSSSNVGPTWLADTLMARRNGCHAGPCHVHLATGLAQHPRAYFRHQAERLGQRQELALAATGQASDAASASTLPRQRSGDRADRPAAGNAGQAVRAPPPAPTRPPSIRRAAKRS